MSSCRGIMLLGMAGLLSPSALNAQAYRPLPMRNATWVESHGMLTPSSNCNFTYDSCVDNIRTGGDTLVNDTVYVLLWRYRSCRIEQTSHAGWPGCDNSYFTVPAHPYAMLRQDTVSRKVFVRPLGEGHEHLLYDFTMDIGPLPQTYLEPSGQYQVVAVDSVLLADGYHKRWRLGLDNFSGPGMIIEGIGSNFGLVEGLRGWFENHDVLVCFGVADTTIYFDPGWGGPDGCDYGASVPDRYGRTEPWAVWPNPAADVLYVELPGSNVIFAEMLNSTGQRVRNIVLVPGHNMLHMGGLPTGLYLLRGANGMTVRVVLE